MSILDILKIVQSTDLTVAVAAGYLSTAATNTVPVRATAYTPQVGNGQRSFVSASINDTNAAGTGARKIRLTYLPLDMSSMKTEIVNLNGVTAVATVATDIALVEKIEVIECGSAGSNQGIISMKDDAAGLGGTMGSIAQNDNVTYWAHHYVANGKTCYPYAISGGATAVSGRLIPVKSLGPTSGTPLVRNVAGTYLYGPQNAAGYPTVEHEFKVPLPIPGPALVTLNCRPDAATASNTHASFEYLEF